MIFITLAYLNRNLIKAYFKYHLFLIFLIFGQIVVGQNYNLTNSFTTKDGLPSNLVYETVCDANGFLWVATDNGISRFDGKRFITYSTKNGLPSNDVIQVIRQNDGTIWANCYKQPPSYFDEKRNKFVCLDANQKIVDLCKNLIINHDDLNNKELLFQNNLGYFVVKNKKITLFKAYKEANGKTYYSLFIDKKYITVENNPYNKNKLNYLQLSFSDKNKILGKFVFLEKQYFSFSSYRANTIFFFTAFSFQKIYNFKSNPFSFETKKKQVPKSIKCFKISNGKLCVTCEEGTVYIYDENTLQLEQTFIINANVNTTYIDSNNNIWIATKNNGLHYYSKSNIKQEVFPKDINTHFLSIRINEDKSIYAGNFQGEIIKKSKKTTSKYFFNNKNTSEIWVKNTHFFPDKIISVSDASLDINFKKNIEIYNALGQLINLKASLKLNDSILILGSSSGIYKFNIVTEKHQSLQFFSERILSLKIKNTHSFYFTANDGLYQYDLLTDTSKIIFDNKNFKSDAIHLFEIINKNSFWISTYKGKLYLITNGKISKDYSSNEQVPINIIELVNRNNLLWIASKEGIYILNYKKSAGNKIFQITKSDGLISNYINDLEYFNDTIYIATDNGISKMATKNSTTNYTLIPRIISVKVNGIINPISSVYNLKSNQTNIGLEVSGVDITGHFKNLEYQLNNNNFIKIAGNFLNLQLKNGSNNLKIRAIDINNVVHAKGLNLHFIIDTPFFKTIWFWIAVSILTTALSLLWINKQRLNLQNRKFQQQLALEKQRNQITADLHDDIGATLSSLQLNSAVANHLIHKDLSTVEGLLIKIENQSKDLADKIGDIVWSMKPGKNEFTTLSNRIKNFSTDILGAIECNFTINIEPEIDALISDISLRKNIILIAKEAINNAAKYSKAQNINISMQHISNQIILKIVDDGIGFDTNLIVGNGLQNMKKRAEEVHGNFEIISNKNKGSSICLRFFVPKL